MASSQSVLKKRKSSLDTSVTYSVNSVNRKKKMKFAEHSDAVIDSDNDSMDDNVDDMSEDEGKEQEEADELVSLILIAFYTKKNIVI